MKQNGNNLTPRELEVLRRLAGGKLQKNIAAELGMKYETLKTHLTHIYAKLGLDDSQVNCNVAASRWYWERHNPEAAAH